MYWNKFFIHLIKHQKWFPIDIEIAKSKNWRQKNMKLFWRKDKFYIFIIVCSSLSLICGTSTLVWLNTYTSLGILLIVFGTIQLICGLSLIAIKYIEIKNIEMTEMSANFNNNNTMTANENSIQCFHIIRENENSFIWLSTQICE